MAKYYSRKVTRNGVTFDSVKEYRRYCELLLLVKAGAITDLQRQVEFELIPAQREPDTVGVRGGVKKGKTIEQKCSYVADFVYKENNEIVVEDNEFLADIDGAIYNVQYLVKSGDKTERFYYEIVLDRPEQQAKHSILEADYAIDLENFYTDADSKATWLDSFGYTRVATETAGGDGSQILGGFQLGGGVAEECGFDIIGAHTAAIVRDTQKGHTAVPDLQSDLGCACIYGIFQQLLHNGGGPFHHFAGGD